MYQSACPLPKGNGGGGVPEGTAAPDTESARRSGGGKDLGSILFADMETEDADPGETYEAAVWAKVVIADLTTRKVAERQESGRMAEGAGTSSGKGKKFASRKAKKTTGQKKRRVEASEEGKDGGHSAADTRKVRLQLRVLSCVKIDRSV